MRQQRSDGNCHWPEIALGAAFALAAPLAMLLPVTHDTVWQMWLARQMIHGVPLYSQLVEVNPPLWFWMAMPLAWIVGISGLAGKIVALAFTIMLIGIALVLLALLQNRSPGRSRWPLYAGAFAATMILPLPAFTQREHLALIGAIPYAALVARRVDGTRVSTPVAIAIGALAALGFGLKPFFALVPIALECWAWKATPRLRPETIVLGSFAILYCAAVVLFAPTYLTETTALVSLTYPYFTSQGLNGFVLPLLLFAIGAVAMQGRTEGEPYLVAALAFLLAFLVQGKGWGYHALPALGMLLVALAVALRGSPWRDAAAAAAIGAMLLPNLRTYHADARLEPVLDAPVGATVAILSFSTAPMWPLVEDRHYRWPLRAFSLWTLPAILEQAPGADRLATDLKSGVEHDLRCNPPDILVFDRQGNFDMRGWFATDPALRALFAEYGPSQKVGNFDIVRRVAARPATPTGCRPIY